MNAQSLPWPPPAAQDESEPQILRFQPRSPSRGALTLDDVLAEYKLPELRGRSKTTIAEYWTCLSHWNAYHADQQAAAESTGTGPITSHRIANPVVPHIQRGQLTGFQSWMEQQTAEDGSPRWSPRTINKSVGIIQSLLQSAADHGLGQMPHKIPPLPTTGVGRKLHLSPEEGDALKRACRVATWPHGLPAPAPLYWETLFAGYCVYGFRTQEQVRYESTMQALQWEDLLDCETTPDGKSAWRLGWIRYTPQKQKRFKPGPLYVPLMPFYKVHLDAIRERSGAVSGPIFPFPLNHHLFYAQWEAILAAAGIAPNPGHDGAQSAYQIRHLRKTSTTWINRHRPGLAPFVQGHAPRDVSGKHYDCSAEDRIIEGLSTLPLPESFQRPLFAGDRQLRLF